MPSYLLSLALLLTMSQMVAWWVEYSRASSLWVIPPKEYVCRMVVTCSKVSTLRVLNRSLPLAIMSFILSSFDPKKRWSGFTQAGTSHLCSTHSPGGIGPLWSSHDTLWASLFRLWPTENIPYPPCLKGPSHNQHGPVLSTFVLNRSIGGFACRDIG